ncbi:hypothetical protein OF83DRAFT_1175075 [Amylostereum chailletii]|nr:hypothetical protein OF83DRAFT_1175075 [Amylostereum chailletii]
MAPGKVTLKQAPPILPRELRGHVSPDSWASRVPQVLRLTARYNQPLFEALWMLAYFILSIAIPAALYIPVTRALDDNDDELSSQSFFRAHFVSISLFIAVSLFFWAPILIWKGIGQQRANVLAKRWVGEDSRTTRYSGYVPLWQITLPGIFRNSTRLNIILPTSSSPTVTAFHQAAYLPSWINGPSAPNNPLPPQLSTDGPSFGKNGVYDALPLYTNNNAPQPFDEKDPVYAYTGRYSDSKV